MIGFAFIPFIIILMIQVLLAVFVYNDSQKRGMNSTLWVLITVLMPNLIGFIIYLVVRSQYGQRDHTYRQGQQHPYVESDHGSKNHGLETGGDSDRITISSTRSTQGKRCQTCGRVLSGSPYKCPYCGEPVHNEMFEDEMLRASSARRGIIAALAIVLVIGMLFFAIFVLTPFRYMNIGEVVDTFKYEIFSGEDKNTSTIISSKYSYWDGTKEKVIDIDKNGDLEIEFEIESKEGLVYAVLIDENNDIVYNFPGNTRELAVFKVRKGEWYQISIVGQQAKGSYKFEWSIK